MYILLQKWCHMLLLYNRQLVPVFLASIQYKKNARPIYWNSGENKNIYITPFSLHFFDINMFSVYLYFFPNKVFISNLLVNRLELMTYDGSATDLYPKPALHSWFMFICTIWNLHVSKWSVCSSGCTNKQYAVKHTNICIQERTKDFSQRGYYSIIFYFL